MLETIELGTVSARGQVAIPADIREQMELKEGTRILFVLTEDTLLIKKVTSQTFAEITKPLKEAARKAGLKESDAVNIVHRVRGRKNR